MAGPWLLGEDSATMTTARAMLIAVRREDDNEDGPGTELSLLELERLAEADGLTVVGTLVQGRGHADPATYLGSGKATKLAGEVSRTGATVVIADGELTPAQARNLQDRAGVRVVDRTALILDIFAGHARSREGRLQVELAQIAYQLPRLRGGGRELSRVGGGRTAGGAGMGVRGPGEMRLELQRRRLRQRAARLRQGTGELALRRERTRHRRARNQVPSVAVTGYTNAGKSALVNRLAGADLETRDEPFATLDPAVRKVTVDGSTFTLTDTVGFVRHLPHQLVDAFRSTLEEVSHSDLALHVVDASAPDALNQITTVHGVLHEIGAGQVPELLVLNKIDIAPPEWVDALQRAYPEAIAVSALTGDRVVALRTAVAATLRDLLGFAGRQLPRSYE
jgi:GTP-binding protein HflX